MSSYRGIHDEDPFWNNLPSLPSPPPLRRIKEGYAYCAICNGPKDLKHWWKYTFQKWWSYFTNSDGSKDQHKHWYAN